LFEYSPQDLWFTGIVYGKKLIMFSVKILFWLIILYVLEIASNICIIVSSRHW
jgi:hypothetical protein